MPDLKTYDLFISHSWDYKDDYYRLCKLLGDYPNFKLRNYSVPNHDRLDGGSNFKLQNELIAQIKPVNIVLILSGMYVKHREWIKKEIEIARELKKPILGIVPWGQDRIPEDVVMVSKEMVNWNATSIVSAIRQHAL